MNRRSFVSLGTALAVTTAAKASPLGFMAIDEKENRSIRAWDIIIYPSNPEGSGRLHYRAENGIQSLKAGDVFMMSLKRENFDMSIEDERHYVELMAKQNYFMEHDGKNIFLAVEDGHEDVERIGHGRVELESYDSWKSAFEAKYDKFGYGSVTLSKEESENIARRINTPHGFNANAMEQS